MFTRDQLYVNADSYMAQRQFSMRIKEMGAKGASKLVKKTNPTDSVEGTPEATEEGDANRENEFVDKRFLNQPKMVKNLQMTANSDAKGKNVSQNLKEV